MPRCSRAPPVTTVCEGLETMDGIVQTRCCIDLEGLVETGFQVRTVWRAELSDGMMMEKQLNCSSWVKLEV
jgi:hypothetical protein